MKPVNRNLADEFHRSSIEGIDAVFERMFKVAGNPLGTSFAEAFDVSENTVKTWRRREAVSTKFLQGFAQIYGTTIDYLLYGKEGRGRDDLALTTAERDLIELYRAAPAPLREAALRVLRASASSAPPTVTKARASDITIRGGISDQVQHVKSNKGQVTQSGQIITVGGGKKK